MAPGTSEVPPAGWRDVLRLLPRAGQLTVAGVVVSAVVDAVLPLAIIVTTGRLISRVSNGPSVDGVLGPLAVLASLLALQQLVEPLRSVVVYRAASRIDGHLRTQAMLATSRPSGIAFLEEPAVRDLVAVATARAGPFRPATPGGAAVGTIGLLVRYAQGVGAALLIARFSLWLAVVMLVGTLLYRRKHRRESLSLARAFDGHLPNYRRAGYLSGLVVEPPAAKETRVFGLGGWLLTRHTQVWRAVTDAMSARRHLARRRQSMYYALMVPLNATAFLVIGQAALDGRIDLGTLTVVLQGSLLLLALGGIGFEEYQIDFGTATLPALAALNQRSDVAQVAGPASAHHTDDLPQHAIRFEGVSFAYPDGRMVFERLNLEIPAGTSLALVGANGAGKTTLVKLLARLYEPSSGRILVDGIDLRELDLASWRARLAVIFQDFVHYELSATANIGFGRLSHMGDRNALVKAAARAGALDLVEGLPKAWDTVLARGYTDGTDLSGGQWQRVALARALLAVDSGAGLLALDEPTANLDVRAEAELFEHLLRLRSGGNGGGAIRRVTTLLISHRFSTVRHAERICVLDRGRVIEQGSHDELVGSGGMYARMFDLQATRFHG